MKSFTGLEVHLFNFKITEQNETFLFAMTNCWNFPGTLNKIKLLCLTKKYDFK